jgi:hypothetical protein
VRHWPGLRCPRCGWQRDRGDRRRGTRPGAGRVRIRRVPNVTRDTLTGFVLDLVAPIARFVPTAGRATSTSASAAIQHSVTKASPSGDSAHVVRPHVHLVGSLVSAGSSGPTRAPSATTSSTTTSTSSHSLQPPHSRHHGLPFYRLLQGAMATEPHPYHSFTRECQGRLRIDPLAPVEN